MNTVTKPTGSNRKALCLWMQAGVVKRKQCTVNYLCRTCRFDQAMKKLIIKNKKSENQNRETKNRSGRIMDWKEKLKTLPKKKQPCIHHMKGRIPFKRCTNDYICSSCEFDHYFYDQYAVNTVMKPIRLHDVDGFKIPQGFYFSQGHTWLKVEEGNDVRIGLDDFMMRLLGPLDGIDVPLIGKTVRQGRADIRISRKDHKAKALSPIGGVVTAINGSIRDNPVEASCDPYGKGWLMMVHADNLRHDLKQMRIGSETEDFFKAESSRLYHVIEETMGPSATDGGQLKEDIFGSLPPKTWDKLVCMFLRS